MEPKKRSTLEIWWDRIRIYVASIALIVVGVVALPYFEVGAKYESKFLEHLAMGVAVAGVLAFFIELTLHKRFADNVFRAAVGYLLREDLRAELTWIYEQTILSELVATIDLEHFEGQGVKVTCHLQRTLRNISLRRQKVVLKGGADEWFVKDHPTQVLEASYRVIEAPARKNLVVKRSDDGIGWNFPEGEGVTLAPEEQTDFTVKFEQWHRENDTLVLTYRYPIKNPRVTVTCKPSLIPKVIFDHRAKYEGDWEISTQTWHPRVVLLPHQDIRVKWHRRDLVEARG